MKIINLINNYYPVKTDNLYDYWNTYYDKHPILKKYLLDDYILNGYDPKEVSNKILINSYNNQKRIIKCTKTLLKILNKINDNINIDIILYHGLANSAGAVDYINNKLTFLLGIEKIVDLKWDKAIKLKELIYHELGHTVHSITINQDLNQYDNTKYEYIYRLYTEGIAMYYQYNKIKKDHSRGSKWVKQCIKLLALLKKEYLHRLNDKISCKEFYGDWWNIFNISDTGYYLGYDFIKSLIPSYTLNQLMKLDIIKIEELLRNYLNN